MRRAQATADLKRIAVELWRNGLDDIDQITAITDLDHEIVADEIRADQERQTLRQGRKRVELDLLEVILLYESGMSLKDVGDRLGASDATVMLRMEEAGIPRRTVGGSARAASTPPEANLLSIRERHLAGETLKDLADEFGTSVPTLSRRLNEIGYSARNTQRNAQGVAALTEAQAKDAFKRYQAGETYAELAERFGTSKHYVKKAVWLHKSRDNTPEQ